MYDERERVPAETDILPSASGAHNKKVETSSLCGHVPHPPLRHGLPVTTHPLPSNPNPGRAAFLAAVSLLLATLALEKTS